MKERNGWIKEEEWKEREVEEMTHTRKMMQSVIREWCKGGKKKKGEREGCRMKTKLRVRKIRRFCYCCIGTRNEKGEMSANTISCPLNSPQTPDMPRKGENSNKTKGHRI